MNVYSKDYLHCGSFLMFAGKHHMHTHAHAHTHLHNRCGSVGGNCIASAKISISRLAEI
jgi:hypothetical protein